MYTRRREVSLHIVDKLDWVKVGVRYNKQEDVNLFSRMSAINKVPCFGTVRYPTQRAGIDIYICNGKRLY